MSRVSVGLVSYKSEPSDLLELFQSLQGDPLVGEWVVVDNAAVEDPAAASQLRLAAEGHGGRYVAAPHNLGFGAAHNLALESLACPSADLHLMVNPDISFQQGALADLVHVLDARPDVGRIMPRVLHPDGTNQYLCKLLPTPLDFAVRRFLPGRLQAMAKGFMDRYELRGIEHSASTAIPFLSGCFILARHELLRKIGGFDPRYFLYMEDVDLGRRMAAESKMLYWPQVTVTHGFHRGSHRSLKLMLCHLRSCWYYYNRWGWIFDSGRSAANKAALEELARTSATS